jgi:hypothetical protein
MCVLDQGRSARCLFSLVSGVMVVLYDKSASCCLWVVRQCECAAGAFGMIKSGGW